MVPWVRTSGSRHLPLRHSGVKALILTTLILLLGANMSVNSQEVTLDAWDDDVAGWEDDWEDIDSTPPITGFFEIGIGRRFEPSEFHQRATMEEIRLRLETQRYVRGVDFSVAADLGWDAVKDKTIGEFRELSARFSPISSIDIQIGRQVLTWGTGDYLFLNDLFPKDWQSFFSGRDDEYLKLPSNAVKTSWFNAVVNVDWVYTPDFDADNYLTGERFSLFYPPAQGLIGTMNPLSVSKPGGAEHAVRLFKTLGRIELAAYGYDGYQKSPNGIDPQTQLATFYALQSIGASARLPIGAGLLNLEVASYQGEDTNGDNFYQPNDQRRYLVGYEWELITRLTANVQWYIERTLQYAKLTEASVAPALEPAERRQLATLRLTYRSENEKLVPSLFWFHSSTDNDGYVRSKLDYRLNDLWQFTAGTHWFYGEKPHTFFSQFEQNSNVFVKVRMNF